eukprot:6185113-Amphidinium_carterae.1
MFRRVLPNCWSSVLHLLTTFALLPPHPKASRSRIDTCHGAKDTWSTTGHCSDRVPTALGSRMAY